MSQIDRRATSPTHRTLHTDPAVGGVTLMTFEA